MNKHNRLVIVANQRSINTKRLSESVVRGASDERIEGIEILFRDPLSATADDVLGCHGIIIGTTENFGYMSGLIKDFFERIYYPCLEKTEEYSRYKPPTTIKPPHKTSLDQAIFISESAAMTCPQTV